MENTRLLIRATATRLTHPLHLLPSRTITLRLTTLRRTTSGLEPATAGLPVAVQVVSQLRLPT